MKKLWSGRFTKDTNPYVDNFTESISFDYCLAYYDIFGSIAHVKMLAKTKIIKNTAAAKITSGLKKIEKQLSAGKFELSTAYEDIHMNIEAALTKLIGPDAQYLHTGRSRNDQVQLDTRMYVRDNITNAISLLKGLQKSLIRLAEKNKDIIMPGFTHLQHAQPVLFSHHMLAYVNMFQRDKERLIDLQKRVNIMPLGSGALAGCSLPLDRKYVAKLLDFDSTSRNSIDSVSDRDYIVELLAAASIIGIHISRLADEIILWNSQEFNYLDIDQSFCTGSSLMPQKKNPDVAELLRSKTGRLNGNLVSILTILKGLPLAYNRDLQEDKPALFDTVKTIKDELIITTMLLNNITVNKKRLIQIFNENDYLLATDIAEYLVTKGVPFRKAHEDVGKLIAYAIAKKKPLRKLSLPEFRTINKIFKIDIFERLNPHSSVSAKKTSGSTNPHMVAKEIQKWKLQLK